MTWWSDNKEITMSKISDERRSEIADGLEDMANTAGLRQGHVSILLTAAKALRAFEPQQEEAVAWPPQVGSKVWVEFEVRSHCSMGEPAWVALTAPGIITDIDFADRATLHAHPAPVQTVSEEMVDRVTGAMIDAGARVLEDRYGLGQPWEELCGMAEDVITAALAPS